jgi:hypothetical protein
MTGKRFCTSGVEGTVPFVEVVITYYSQVAALSQYCDSNTIR